MKPTPTFAGLLLTVACFALPTSPATAQVYLNEIFFDPGGAATDLRDEFIELRGPAGLSLTNHYLVFLENELPGPVGDDAGTIENLFDLGPFSLGSNGFLAFLQKFNRYAPSQIVTGANVLVNNGANKPGTGPGAFPGFGNNAAEGSTLGASDLDSAGDPPTTGALENSGFTAMLIRNDSGVAPVLGFDLDADNNGLDIPTGQSGWTILDSIGLFSEVAETETGRLYGLANFAIRDAFLPPDFVPNVPEGSSWQFIDHEIEYVGRWGNSTGYTVDDWQASNLTDNSGSGSSGVGGNVGPLDLRQSGDPHPVNDGNPNTPAPQPSSIETNRNVPYGTKLLDNVGGPNYLTGDFNADGTVDAADYTAWRDTRGSAGNETNHPGADANHDFAVNDADNAVWRSVYGSPNATPTPATSIPEPMALTAAVSCLACLATRRR